MIQKIKLVPTKLIATCLVIGFMAGIIATLNVQSFLRDYQLRSPIQSPAVQRIRSPIPDDYKRPETPPAPTKGPAKAEEPGVIDDRDIAEYIKSKDWDYSVAIRLAKSENFYNLTGSFDCARMNTANRNNSYDVGIFQINSVHASTLAKLGMTMDDMKDCKKNIDFAYEHVYKHSGWQPWAAYKNGSYLTHNDFIN